MPPVTRTFYDPRSGTATHVVHCPETLACAIVDPVFDIDPASGRTGRRGLDEIACYVRGGGLRPEWLLETHVHHDHVSGAAILRDELGGRIAIGAGVREVAPVIADVYGLGPPSLDAFDRLLEDGEEVALGSLAITAVATPGHTLDHLSYRVDDAVFVGDTLFMPDSGTARCDFHGGDPVLLYRSIGRLLDLPDDARMFVCHDYGRGGEREPAWETTVGEQRRRNVMVGAGTDEAAFVAARRKRDAGLDVPALLLQSLPLNIRAGRLPAPCPNGRVILPYPLDVARDAM